MKGIRETPFGWHVYIRIHGRQYARRFPKDTPISTLKDWRERKNAEVRYGATRTDSPTFSDDAREYLSLIEGMPTFADRKYRITRWVSAFGPRTRATISAKDIRAQLELWRRRGREDGQGYSPASLNLYRTALLHLWTVLDGRSGQNPVRDVPRYDESASGEIVRAQPVRLLYRLLARIGGKTRARLRVMLWTGLPHGMLGQLTAADVDLTRATLRVPRRKKGSGHASKVLPLLPPAVIAFRKFDEAKAWGPFSRSSMHRALERAIAAENKWRARFEQPALGHIRPYDFRHTFGAEIAKVLKDDAMVAEFLCSRQSRYRGGALEQRLAHAAQLLAGTFGTFPRSAQ